MDKKLFVELATMSDFVNEHKLIASLILVSVLLILRWLLVRLLKKRPAGDDERPKRLINSVNNVASLLIAVVLVVIWLSEIRFFALSIAAFVVALVIATREFIQCLLGAVYIASARLFNIGDWVRVGHYYGEVVRSDWLSTTLLEVDIEACSYDYTGKTLVIPNNQFVANTATNLNFMKRYVAHSFRIVREANEGNIFAAKEFLLNQATQYCSSFSDVAERYNGLIEKRLSINLPGPSTSVRISTTELGKNALTVTVFCPTREAVGIEQKITHDFMAFWYDMIKREGVISKPEQSSSDIE